MASNKNRWNDKEKALIKAKYAELGPTKMMDLLPNRSFSSIKMAAWNLGVSTGRRKRKKHPQKRTKPKAGFGFNDEMMERAALSKWR